MKLKELLLTKDFPLVKKKDQESIALALDQEPTMPKKKL